VRPAATRGRGAKGPAPVASRVAAELLHPPFAPTGTDNSVNAWLASDPTQDPTSAVADSVFRKDWVSENFTGGRLKAGGNVAGDQDSYSFGCAMLFIYYLKDQLDFSMPGIVQNGPTLAGAYGAATGGRTGGFWAFKSLLDQHFPIGVKVSTDDPFPLSTNALATRVGPAAAASGNATAALITNVDGRVFYTCWQLGEGGKAFGEVGPGLQTDATPAAALVGPGHDYLFVLAKDMDGNLQLNQGQLGRPLWDGSRSRSRPGSAPRRRPRDRPPPWSPSTRRASSRTATGTWGRVADPSLRWTGYRPAVSFGSSLGVVGRAHAASPALRVRSSIAVW
jgi:hypothetical protein